MNGLRVLVVDDDPDVAEGLADVLEPEVAAVEMVYSGEAAIGKFRESKFDLTFMDMRLPGMNGLESFLEIRKLEPDARVVMMTGFSVEQLVDQALAHGAWVVLRKPLDPDGILRLLGKVGAPGET